MTSTLMGESPGIRRADRLTLLQIRCYDNKTVHIDKNIYGNDGHKNKGECAREREEHMKTSGD